MPSYHAPLRDFQFLIHEWLDRSEARDLPSHEQASEDIIDAVLTEGARFCETVLQPLNVVGDTLGCRWENGVVNTPDGFREAYRAYAEAGWTGLTADSRFGGQGLPYFLGLAMAEMLTAANTAFATYPALAHGASETIQAHAAEVWKRLFVPRMVSGQWLGTMNLTEPQCGSDLGLIRTRAVPHEDGNYRISGTKIWITAGEHDLAENIIHLVLARIPGSPPGTRGISLFIVPKFLIEDDGSLGPRNGVRCGSIDHKMGIKGSATCEINYDQATGYLVGEPNRGLAHMFTMMNGARLETGVQGLGVATVSYQNAVHFARERLQGRALDGAKVPEHPADPIIVHPDVRRMLLIGKAFTEGARALAIDTAMQLELEHHHPDPNVRRAAGFRVALMTPIIKAYFTDMGSEVANLGLQVHGGAGYIRDTGVEQFVRDVRITQIWEGTNGIQALDLVGRKLTAESGALLSAFFEPIARWLEANGDDQNLAEFVQPLAEATERLKQVTSWVYQHMAADPLEAGAASSDYLRLFALTAMAWVWARQAATSQARLADGAPDADFYTDKLHTARFFMTRMLPDTIALDAKIRAGAAPLMALQADAF